MTGKLVTQAQWDSICARLKALEQQPEPTAIECCDGPFVLESNRSSWWAPWTGIVQGNQGTQTAVQWRTIGTNSVTAPECETDLGFTAFLGSHYLRLRDARVYSWFDVRLLVNGAAVWTRTFDVYWYVDHQHVDGGVPIDIFPGATVTGHRLAIPAGATVEAQVQYRWNVNGAGADAYARYIGGLRSRALYHFHPRDEVRKLEEAA